MYNEECHKGTSQNSNAGVHRARHHARPRLCPTARMVYIRLRGELKCNFRVHLGAIPIFVVRIDIRGEEGGKAMPAGPC